MITSWDIYWITRLDSVCMFLIAIGFVLLMLIIFFPLIAEVALELEKQSIVKCELLLSASLLLVCLCGVFVPSTKEFAAIYLIPKIANNEQMQKIPDNAAKLLNVKMEEWIKDTIKDKKEDK